MNRNSSADMDLGWAGLSHGTAHRRMDDGSLPFAMIAKPLCAFHGGEIAKESCGGAPQRAPTGTDYFADLFSVRTRL